MTGPSASRFNRPGSLYGLADVLPALALVLAAVVDFFAGIGFSGTLNPHTGAVGIECRRSEALGLAALAYDFDFKVAGGAGEFAGAAGTPAGGRGDICRHVAQSER